MSVTLQGQMLTFNLDLHFSKWYIFLIALQHHFKQAKNKKQKTNKETKKQTKKKYTDNFKIHSFLVFSKIFGMSLKYLNWFNEIDSFKIKKI